MDRVLEFVRRERLWPLFVLLAGLLMLLPRLGQPGFWEPQEIKVADQARSRLERHSLDEILRAVSARYRVREADLKRGTDERQVEARNVALYLADEHTVDSYSELRRALEVEKHEVVESVIKGMRERLGNPAETELRGHVKAIEANLAKRDKAQRPDGPPLTLWAVAGGFEHIEKSEWGGRLPLALLGLIALMFTYALGARLAGPRAGLIAALVLLAFPLFILQSRQLTSDIGAVAGSSGMMFGLLGLSWPAGDLRKIPMWYQALRYAADATLIAAGAVICYYAAGVMLGLLPPLLAVAFANPIAAVADRRKNEPADHPDAVPGEHRLWRLIHLLVIGVIAAIAAGLLITWLLTAIFELVPPVPGDRAIFGHSWQPVTEHVEALGGSWRAKGNLNETFNSLFEQIAFGLFPWSALAPIALAYLAMGPRAGRRNWAGYVLLIWAAVAWALATVMFRKVGPVQYPALAAVAVAVGIWLDDLLASRAAANAGETETKRWFGLPPRLPLVGFFVAAAAITLGKDIKAFPEMMTSLHVLEGTVSYPEDLSLTSVLLSLAFLFALVGFLAIWLWAPAGRRDILGGFQHLAGRWGVHVMLAVGLIVGLFLAQVWTPALSRKLSSKHMFSVYHQLKSPGDRLGIMGAHGSGPKYYAGDSFTTLGNRNHLLEFLEQDGRAFALVPAGELCPVHRQTAKTGQKYHVLDDSHAKFLLMSNQLEKGETDRNPLSRSILRERPANIGREVHANFDDRVELIGVDMPHSVERGDSFEMTLYFKVLRPVGGNWKIFAHYDTAGMRFQGDHDPIKGRCGTAFWQPGDYIVDTFTVEAGDISYPKRPYQARIGFFQGSHGNWKNMPVKSGNADATHRVFVGEIQVR